MSLSIRPKTSIRSAALLAGVMAVAFLPGCETAPGEGTVEMGGKEGRAKIQPGNIPAPEGAKPKTTGATPGRSIKERPNTAQ